MNNQISPIIANSDGTVYKMQFNDSLVTAPQIYTRLEQIEMDIPVVTNEVTSRLVWDSAEKPPVNFGEDCFSFEFRTAKFIHIYVNHLSHEDLTAENINSGDGTKEYPFTNLRAALAGMYCIVEFLVQTCQQNSIGVYVEVSGVYDQPFTILSNIYSKFGFSGQYDTDVPIVVDFKNCICNIDCRKFDFSYIGNLYLVPEDVSVCNMASSITMSNKDIRIRQYNNTISECIFEIMQPENDYSKIVIETNLMLNSNIIANYGSIVGNIHNCSCSFTQQCNCGGNWKQCSIVADAITGGNNHSFRFYNGIIQTYSEIYSISGDFYSSHIKAHATDGKYCMCCNCEVELNQSTYLVYWHANTVRVNSNYTFYSSPIDVYRSSNNTIELLSNAIDTYIDGAVSIVRVYNNSGLCVNNNIAVSCNWQLTSISQIMFVPINCFGNYGVDSSPAILKDWKISVSANISGDYLIGYAGSVEPSRNDCDISLLNFTVDMPDCVTGPYWETYRADRNLKESDFCVWFNTQY